MSYALIAYISQAKGLKGEVVVNPTDDLSFALREGLEVWVVPPSLRGVRETQVCTVQPQNGRVLITLSGIENRNDALALVGRHLLVRLDDDSSESPAPFDDNAGEAPINCSPPRNDGINRHLSGDAPIECSVVGLEVDDVAEGYLGVIVEERVGVAQTLWVVDGPFGEVLIPAVEPFIVARAENRVTMVLPKGLLELNA